MTTKVLDLFNGGTAGDDLNTHTPDTDVEGGGWSVDPANGLELDGSGNVNGNSFTQAGWIDVGVTDQRVTLNIDENSSNNSWRIMLRHNGNGYSTRTSYDVLYRNAASGDTVRIYRVSAGSQTELIDTTSAIHDNTVAHECVVEIVGDTITVYFDSTEVLSATDSNITTGNNAGFTYDSGAATIDFQDILIEEISSATPHGPLGLPINGPFGGPFS